MDFFFPRLELYLTAIPKAGCTSSMNFFTSLELFLLNNDLTLSDNLDDVSIELKNEDLASRVHLSDSPTSRYLTTIKSALIPSSTLFIGIYRDPIARFESFWIDKVVLQRDSNYFTLSNSLLREKEITSIVDTTDAAKVFLNTLDFSKPEFIDPHIRPQSSFMLPVERYDLLLETKNLDHLPRYLAEKSPKYNFLRKLKFPHHNQPLPLLKNALLDFELVNAIYKVYESDFQVFQVPPTKASLSTVRFYTSEQMEFILKSRAYRRDALTAERDALVKSLTWRITRPYRNLKNAFFDNNLCL